MQRFPRLLSLNQGSAIVDQKPLVPSSPDMRHAAGALPAVLSHAAGHVPADADLFIGKLFAISSYSSLERRIVLTQLEALYFESLKAPIREDGWPSSEESVGHFLGKIDLDRDKNFLNFWPRGFQLSVGERNQNGQIVPYICVISPYVIPGARSQSIQTFKRSRAGKLAKYLRTRIPHPKLYISFAKHLSLS